MNLFLISGLKYDIHSSDREDKTPECFCNIQFAAIFPQIILEWDF